MIIVLGPLTQTLGLGLCSFPRAGGEPTRQLMRRV